MEVGAGHGKLSFLLLRKLVELREFWPEGCRFLFVMTDFTQEDVDFWKQHDALDPFIRDDLLDFAVFSALPPPVTTPPPRRLTAHTRPSFAAPRRGKRPGDQAAAARDHAVQGVVPESDGGGLQLRVRHAAPGRLPRVRRAAARGALHSDRAAVGGGSNGGPRYARARACQSLSPHTRPTSPTDIIRKIKCEWHYRPCSTDYYAGDAQLNAVLSQYVNSFREASVLIPLGGFRLLRNIQHMANGRCMVLVGDKAYSQEDELAGLRDPHVAIHGSFSFMVRRRS